MTSVAPSPTHAPLPGLAQASPRAQREQVECYLCGGRACTPFVEAEDDLTGKPGRFTFVTCSSCGLHYQNPRIRMEHIGAYYDDEYIAHRRKSDWGPLTGFFNWAMDRHDRQKDALVSRYVALGSQSKVLDVGCAVGTFLEKLRVRYGVSGTGVDFKDLSASPGLANVDFRCGSSTSRSSVRRGSISSRCGTSSSTTTIRSERFGLRGRSSRTTVAS